MCPLANSKGTCPSPGHGQSTEEVLQLPESIPWAKLAYSSLPAKVYREACTANALQWADPDKGFPQDLSFSFWTSSLSDIYIASCLNDIMHPILEKIILRCRKMRRQGGQSIPAKTCWIQISLGGCLIWAMCPLTAWWPVPQLLLGYSSSSGTTHHNGLETGENQAGEECWNHFKNLWRENE